MATISITISDSQMAVLKNALADLDSALSSSDIDDAYIKQTIIDFSISSITSFLLSVFIPFLFVCLRISTSWG